MNVVDTALTLAASNSSSAYVFAFAAGIATSVGPCVAPRYAAITIVSSGEQRGRIARVGSFVFGTVIVCAAMASVASFTTQLARGSSIVYWMLAIALGLSGASSLWRGGRHTCKSRGVALQSTGAAFLLGAGTSVAISPCCAPILIALGALGSTSLRPGSVVALVAVYTIGHVAPVLLAYGAANAIHKLVSGYGNAAATVTSAVTVALGLLYAVLA